MFNKKERTLLFSYNLWCLSEGMLGPLFGVYCAKFNSSPMDISSVWAAYLVSVGVVVIALGFVSDYLHKEKLLLAGYALQTIFVFCYILVDNSKQLAILQVALGLSGGLSTTTWYVLYSRYEDRSKEGLAWGLANGLSSIYMGVALLTGGVIISYTSFNTLFTVMGLVQLIATLYLSRIIYVLSPQREKLLNSEKLQLTLNK